MFHNKVLENTLGYIVSYHIINTGSNFLLINFEISFLKVSQPDQNTVQIETLSIYAYILINY